MEFLALRSALIATANELNDSGINQGTSGNLSGEHNFSCKPSSEWRFHRDIYVARDAASAIVHTHSVHATALACLNRSIAAFHYMVAVAGGHDIGSAGRGRARVVVRY